MKVVLDACVLYPTVLREILLKVAQAGLYQPVWSARILEEWARATRKLGPGAETVARGEIALVRAGFPKAETRDHPEIEARLFLPDENDRHVLATAIVSHADAILTFNASDFPRHVLAEEGIGRLDPDGFLRDLWQRHPDQVAAAVEQVRGEAERLSGEDWPVRRLLKKAGLPRLGKALDPK